MLKIQPYPWLKSSSSGCSENKALGCSLKDRHLQVNLWVQFIHPTD
jgi:hypothetical protein